MTINFPEVLKRSDGPVAPDGSTNGYPHTSSSFSYHVGNDENTDPIAWSAVGTDPLTNQEYVGEYRGLTFVHEQDLGITVPDGVELFYGGDSYKGNFNYILWIEDGNIKCRTHLARVDDAPDPGSLSTHMCPDGFVNAIRCIIPFRHSATACCVVYEGGSTSGSRDTWLMVVKFSDNTVQGQLKLWEESNSGLLSDPIWGSMLWNTANTSGSSAQGQSVVVTHTRADGNAETVFVRVYQSSFSSTLTLDQLNADDLPVGANLVGASQLGSNSIYVYYQVSGDPSTTVRQALYWWSTLGVRSGPGETIIDDLSAPISQFVQASNNSAIRCGSSVRVMRSQLTEFDLGSDIDIVGVLSPTHQDMQSPDVLAFIRSDGNAVNVVLVDSTGTGDYGYTAPFELDGFVAGSIPAQTNGWGVVSVIDARGNSVWERVYTTKRVVNDYLEDIALLPYSGEGNLYRWSVDGNATFRGEFPNARNHFGTDEIGTAQVEGFGTVFFSDVVWGPWRYEGPARTIIGNDLHYTDWLDYDPLFSQAVALVPGADDFWPFAYGGNFATAVGDEVWLTGWYEWFGPGHDLLQNANILRLSVDKDFGWSVVGFSDLVADPGYDPGPTGVHELFDIQCVNDFVYFMDYNSKSVLTKYNLITESIEHWTIPTDAGTPMTFCVHPDTDDIFILFETNLIERYSSNFVLQQTYDWSFEDGFNGGTISVTNVSGTDHKRQFNVFYGPDVKLIVNGDYLFTQGRIWSNYSLFGPIPGVGQIDWTANPFTPEDIKTRQVPYSRWKGDSYGPYLVARPSIDLAPGYVQSEFANTPLRSMLYAEGALVDRPDPGVKGRLYLDAINDGVAYVDTGSEWVQLGRGRPYTVTTDYNVDSREHEIDDDLVINASSAMDIYLPVLHYPGRVISFRRVDSSPYLVRIRTNNIEIDGIEHVIAIDGVAFIQDGKDSYITIAPQEFLQLLSDGVHWHIIDSY